jgi:hypothetical protein
MLHRFPAAVGPLQGEEQQGCHSSLFSFTLISCRDAHIRELKTLPACVCSAVLAHMMLNEKLNIFGILGCVLCIVGSMTIVLHAPEEREIVSLLQVWNMALQPGERSLLL